MRRFVHRRHAGGKDERGVETTAMILVLPFLVVMILALVDVGLMFQARMNVTNVARDLVRNIAAEGGNYNPRTTVLEEGDTWILQAQETLYRGGECRFGNCTGQPTIQCTTTNGNINVISNAGDLITCTVTYPYKGVNKPLLDSPLGLGFGTLIKPFEVEATARSETGENG